MTKDEMKNRISLALKDPTLQQGFELICKENAELKTDMATAIPLLERAKEISESLTKAKEIIKRLLCVVRNHLCIADVSFNALINDAEKILKEE